MKKEWKTYVNELGIPVTFLNKEGKLTQFISTEEFGATSTLEDLIELVKTKLRCLGFD